MFISYIFIGVNHLLCINKIFTVRSYLSDELRFGKVSDSLEDVTSWVDLHRVFRPLIHALTALRGTFSIVQTLLEFL